MAKSVAIWEQIRKFCILLYGMSAKNVHFVKSYENRDFKFSLVWVGSCIVILEYLSSGNTDILSLLRLAAIWSTRHLYCACCHNGATHCQLMVNITCLHHSKVESTVLSAVQSATTHSSGRICTIKWHDYEKYST